MDTDLYLRLTTVDDAPYLYHLIDANRAYLREWLPFIDYSMSVLDTKAYLRAVTDIKNISEEVYVILYQKSIAGIIGFKGIDNVNRKVEIGYWLSGALQGKGIMRRSCKALLQYAFEEMRMNRIQIKVGVGNTKSSKIPQKLGFQLEGVQRDGEYLNGHFHDLEIYSLLFREWQQQS
ncbi:GNAT family N-acetyltransferase [Pontibacter pamirensis]|uniref:GNAT family N-acetyltransferase n=1 Tax=Pontibacter pamirensis TaxID=2562824 RepID=UPI001F23AE91|nr:GNAT family protein [Pontibacter pamirensis]